MNRTAFFVNGIDVSDYLIRCDEISIVNRNRNWTPVFQGFNFELSGNVPDTPAEGQLVLFSFDQVYHYLGYIVKVRFDYDNSVYKITANHFLQQLENFKITAADLKAALIRNAADFATAVSFTVDTANDYILKTGHGLSNGDRIIFRNTGGALPEPLLSDHIYYVKVNDADSFRVYEDYIEYIRPTATGVDDSYINITLAGTGTNEFTSDINFDLYNDFSVYRDIPVGIYPEGDLNQTYHGNISLKAGDVVYPITYRGYQSPVFYDLVMLDGNGETLPIPLSADRAYIATFDPANEGFSLYDTYADYLGNDKIGGGLDASSGNFFMSVIARYSGTTNECKYPTAIVQMRHLVETIFGLIGVVLDTTAVDNLILFRYTTAFQQYTWEKFYFMESMLFNLNQTEVGQYETIDSLSTLTCLEFIADLFGKLGFNIKFTGDIDSGIAEINVLFKIVSQKRREVDDPLSPNYGLPDVIYPDEEIFYPVDDDHKVEYETDEILSDDAGGYIHTRRHAAGNVSILEDYGIPFVYSHPLDHMSDKNDAAENAVRRPEGKSGGQRNTFSWFENYIIFLKDIFETNGQYNVQMLREGYLGKEFIQTNINNFAFIPYSPSINDMISVSDWDQQRIVCKADYLIDETWTVKELYFDIEREEIKIIQERIKSWTV